MRFKVTIVYEVEAKDEDEAIYRVWDAVNYGKEETAHSCASESLKRVYVSGEPERIKQ